MHEAAQRISCRHDLEVELGGHERGARWVVGVTAAMMILELVVGYATNSMALTADGWHMATHAGALGMSSLAYWFARTRAHDARFTFGTGKVHALAGYTSALVLAIVAVSMMVESMRRLWHPEAIHFAEALPVAVLGLLVNIASIKLLDHDDHDHDHHEHDADPDHHEAQEHDAHHDHNHRAAYMHVVADAFTSVLAILALLAGRYAGWRFFDPLMGIVGGVVVLRWGIGLCRSSGRQLVDASASGELEQRVRATLEAIDDVRVGDLHLWEIGPGRRGCVAALTTSVPRPAAFYRARILATHPVAHLTVEVHICHEGHERYVA
ncbi:MAG TPA: CDF family Co(II)/Ni(II) efflux transporter DmeF [Polyangiaceae bacterium]|jgi:cation diffusion facilitator family transporter